MDSFGFFGLMGFAMAIYALERVKRLERLLRENHIRPAGAGDLGVRFREQIGKTVKITLDEGEGEGSTTTACRVLDADEEWVHVIRNEGKKNQRELLLRLSDVKQVKG